MEGTFNIYKIQSPNYDECNGANPCIICGENIKDPKHWVEMTTDGDLLPVGTPDGHPDSMGCFPVGSGCIKKIPKKLFARAEKRASKDR